MYSVKYRYSRYVYRVPLLTMIMVDVFLTENRYVANVELFLILIIELTQFDIFKLNLRKLIIL